MSHRGHAHLEVTEPVGADPVRCDEYGYGLGRPDGILVMAYRSAGRIGFPQGRVDWLHQFYWVPGGTLSVRCGTDTRFIGPREVFWARRAVTHEVCASDPQVVYRVCLREVPPGLTGLRAGAASIDEEAAGLVRAIGRPGVDESFALDARARIMSGLGPRGAGGRPGGGAGAPRGGGPPRVRLRLRGDGRQRAEPRPR